MGDTLIYVAYPVTTAVVFLFGLFACAITWLHLRRVGRDTQEFFLTARGTASVWRIAWSFYAGVMGSWALFSPPSYAYTAGAPYEPAANPEAAGSAQTDASGRTNEQCHL